MKAVEGGEVSAVELLIGMGVNMRAVDNVSLVTISGRHLVTLFGHNVWA